MNKEQVRSVIEKAFDGVRLDGGISLLQTQVIDKYGEGYTEEEFETLVHKDITDDWKVLTVEDLDKCQVAHLDGKGFRYYIPAIMLSVLNDVHDRVPWSVARQLFGLCPDPNLFGPECELANEDFWNYCIGKYETLGLLQRQAIAQFLYWVPRITRLNPLAQELVEKAIQNYWKDYLPSQTTV